MTYSEWFVAGEKFSVLVVDLDLQLLHAFATTSQQSGEHLLEIVLDGELSAGERNLGVGDISNASGGAWHKVVSVSLKRREFPDKK